MDLEEILEFRKRHVGRPIIYKYRALGSTEDWKLVNAVITERGVKAADGDDHFSYYDFPAADFEYSEIQVQRPDGNISRLDPSPATSRAQSRAASQEREVIARMVVDADSEGRSQRTQIAQLLQQSTEQSQRERETILSTQTLATEEGRANARAAAAERRQLQEESKAAAAAASQERVQMLNAQRQMMEEAARERQQIMQALGALTNAATATQQTMMETLAQIRQQTQQQQQQQQQPPQPAPHQRLTQHNTTATTTTTTTTTEPQATIGRRQELDVLFPANWDLSTPASVISKRLQVTQYFEITARSSPYRLRAYNVLSVWMDQAFEQQVLLGSETMSESMVEMGKTALENLRATVAQEDRHINARSLYDATAVLPGDKFGEAIAQLEKSASKGGRGGRGRGRGGWNNNNNNSQNNNNSSSHTNNNTSNGQQQGNWRGPARQ